MKDNILEKLKKVIFDNAKVVYEKDDENKIKELILTSDDLDHIIEEMDKYMEFYSDSEREGALQEVYDEFSKTTDYVKKAIENIKDKNNKKVERSDDVED